MKILFKASIVILILLFTSCRVHRMQYAKDVTIDSKFGFQMTFDGKLPNDTVSLLVDGVTVLEKVVFPPTSTDSSDNTDAFFTRVDLDNKKLKRTILGTRYEPIDFQEKRKIKVEVIKNNVKSEFLVDLNKGKFIYIEDFFYYGDIDVKKHLIAKTVSIVSKSKKETERDFSISNEVIRLIQFKKAPAVY